VAAKTVTGKRWRRAPSDPWQYGSSARVRLQGRYAEAPFHLTHTARLECVGFPP